MKKPARVCVILPRLPPVVDGLGDYTIQIWKHYHDSTERNLPSLDRGSGWHFLTVSDSSSSVNHFPQASIAALPKDPAELANVLEQARTELVLLQFSGYGFDRNALPYFLADGLKAWLNKSPSNRLVTMFHELYAFGPPWKKAFWLSPAQQLLTLSLCKMSAVAVTSNHAYFTKLKSWLPDHDIRLIPIGANFENPKNLAKDWTSLSIFGKTRLDAIELHGDLLRFLTKQRLVTTVVLSGEEPSAALRKKESATLSQCIADTTTAVKEIYNFPTDDVPDHVAQCGFSITNVTSEFLAKSGRFHLACALGQVTLSLKGGTGNCAPLLDAVSLLEYDRSHLGTLQGRLTDIALLTSIGQEARHLSETEFSWKHNNAKWREILQQ